MNTKIGPVVRTERLEALSASAMSLCEKLFNADEREGCYMRALLGVLDDEVHASATLILALEDEVCGLKIKLGESPSQLVTVPKESAHA